ncbi:DUF308 domain-containing protein [Kocuria marina]|uniref:DUF308 domain-containing protein n=1 Tax=Kocuria marina TaxID=223184 RepID=UPI0011A9AA8A|nr:MULTISPECIES: DUF308 domain-containing protein [Kocuria]MCT2022099.1 DUF308 domain-containing protein [Kocuria marina]
MHDSRHRSTPPHATHSMGPTSGGSPSGGSHSGGPHAGDPRGEKPSPHGPRSGDSSDGDGARLRFAAVAAALAVLASALVVGDVWSTVAGLALAIAGIVLGIIALARSRGSSSRVLITVLAVLAIVWGVINALGGGTRLLVWPATQVYQDCTERALTLSSTSRCEQQLNDNVWKHFSGAPLETGTGHDEHSPAASEPATSEPTPSESAASQPSPSATGTPTTTSSGVMTTASAQPTS